MIDKRGRHDEEQAYLLASMCKATVYASLSLLTPATDEAYRAQVTSEPKRMLLAYLTPVFAGS